MGEIGHGHERVHAITVNTPYLLHAFYFAAPRSHTHNTAPRMRQWKQALRRHRGAPPSELDPDNAKLVLCSNIFLVSDNRYQQLAFEARRRVCTEHTGHEALKPLRVYPATALDKKPEVRPVRRFVIYFDVSSRQHYCTLQTGHSIRERSRERSATHLTSHGFSRFTLLTYIIIKAPLKRYQKDTQSVSISLRLYARRLDKDRYVKKHGTTQYHKSATEKAESYLRISTHRNNH